MRYFRYTGVGNIGYVKGYILTYPDHHDIAIPKKDDPRWEEVLVTEKPQPKTLTKKVALFEFDGYFTGKSKDVLIEGSSQAKDSETLRVSDWVEVTFTERTDR